jgi:Ni,Fe-hydrogenase maturation factor
MKIYVFGNPDEPNDNAAFKVAKKFAQPNVEFIIVNPNQDLPFENESEVVLMDVVDGINKVKLIEGDNIDRLVLSPSVSAHDYDLGFQLKYLKKLGKLGDVKIIGLPKSGKIDYSLIQSIFKKLVAQDIQGS